MPHPERCAEEILGNIDGRALFASAVGALSMSHDGVRA
jgi:phosphoribosylformylglycinamidine (FGAM) synthase-like amidotransferase family enzyme